MYYIGRGECCAPAFFSLTFCKSGKEGDARWQFICLADAITYMTVLKTENVRVGSSDVAKPISQKSVISSSKEVSKREKSIKVSSFFNNKASSIWKRPSVLRNELLFRLIPYPSYLSGKINEIPTSWFFFMLLLALFSQDRYVLFSIDYAAFCLGTESELYPNAYTWNNPISPHDTEMTGIDDRESTKAATVL